MMKKNILATCCFAFLTLQSWPSADIPVEQSTIEPPPETAPIDSFLTIALFIAVIAVGYYFNRRSKTLLNNK
jgi:hypothetical protein